MSTPIIRVAGFRKAFFLGLRRRRTDAALDIGFEVMPGEIFGFLGPNGAGKTTTIKALLGLIRPDGGTIEILGHDPSSLAWRAKVGYLPEHPTFYEFLTAFELVTWFAQLAGMSRHEAETSARRQLARVKLDHAMNRRLRGYSKGMLQRAGLAQALVADPKLLILDEPMTGLDPLGRRDVRELILELRAEGRCVFYSTHILPDVEVTCDRVAIVHQGRTRKVGRLEDILGESTQSVSLRLANVGAAQLDQLAAQHKVTSRGDSWIALDFATPEAAQAVAVGALGQGARIESLVPNREDLESLFLRTLGPNVQETRTP